MREKTYRTALGGILTALAVTMLFLGSVFPFAEISGPALASVCILLIREEMTAGAALSVYAAVSALSLILVPDKESVLLFVCFFGWFPVLKYALDRRMGYVPALILKLIAFNASIVLMYYIILKVVVMQTVAEEFAEYTTAMYVAVMLLANFTVIILDFAFSKIVFLYRNVWRKKLVR